MTRRLTNQDAFDSAMLHLLIQGHSCLNASGQARYRGPRGKSALGALIPDELYVSSMEGKKLHHWLAARGSEYDGLRERLGGVTPSLLDDLQDLHDRSGACMPSLYRHLALAGAQRIAQSFKLSMRLVLRCATYQHMRGPQIFSAATTRARAAAARAIAAARAVDVPSAPAIEASSAPAVDVPSAPAIEASSAPAIGVSSAPAIEASSVRAIDAPGTPAIEVSSARAIDDPRAAATDVSSAPAVNVLPELAAPATPAPEPMRVTNHPQEELDLIARGIANAIAAASATRLDRR